MTQLTYGQLKQVLCSLGFSVHALKGGALGYQHESGARLIFPNLPDQDKVMPRHLVAVRVVLEAFGIDEPPPLAG
jgi:hypothetical protein